MKGLELIAMSKLNKNLSIPDTFLVLSCVCFKTTHFSKFHNPFIDEETNSWK